MQNHLPLPEALLSDIYEKAVDPILTIDIRGRIRAANPACKSLLGYEPEKLIGLNVNVLMPEPYFSQHDGYLAEYLRSGVRKIIGIGREVLARHKSGEIIPIHLAVSEVRGEHGERLFIGVIRDISDLKEAEKKMRAEQERAQRYLDVAAVLLIALDLDCNLTMLNRKGAELIGVTESELLGKRFCERFIHPEDLPTFRDSILRLRAEEGAKSSFLESRLIAANGEVRQLAWQHQALIESGKITGILSSGTDMTDYKKMTERLVERESLARLGEMAAVVAHEVKNPIAGISGALKILAHKARNERESDILEEILARLNVLDNIVNDLLVFARPQPPRLAPVPLRLLLEHCRDTLIPDPLFTRVEIRLPETELTLYADRQLLIPVFTNIFLNAAQAMEGLGRIEVSVKEQDGNCELAFADTGPGIPEEHRERLFEPFFTTRSRGTGLGLAICKRTIERHGGLLKFHCPDSGGTIFLMKLPLV